MHIKKIILSFNFSCHISINVNFSFVFNTYHEVLNNGVRLEYQSITHVETNFNIYVCICI